MADADAWIISAVDTSAIDSGDVSLNISSRNLPTRERNWEYILIPIGNFLVAYWQAKWIMEAISGVYTLKEDKKTKQFYGPPDLYFRTNIQKFR